MAFKNNSYENVLLNGQGGVCIDLNQMNNVIDVHTEDFDITVEPGLSRKSLNTFLRDTGLWFPVGMPHNMQYSNEEELL